MVDYIYAKTDLILTSSQSFIEAISSRGVKSNKLEYWPQYAEDFYAPFKGVNELESLIPSKSSFNIIFTGNLGVAQGLEILVDVARRLQEETIDVKFNMVGDGRFKARLIELVAQSKVENYFNFIDRQIPHDIPKLISLCDCGLIILNKNPLFAKTIPAKTQSYLACGIPILASADGEIFNLVANHSLGFASPSGDVEALVDNIKKFVSLKPEDLKNLSNLAIEFDKNHFSKNRLLNQIDDWFEELINRRI
jgi:glycosyltransferase involved in cell wall biosynthesis